MDLWDKCTRTRRGYLEATGAFDFLIAVGRHRHLRVRFETDGSDRPRPVGGPIDLPGGKETLKIKCRAGRDELSGKNKHYNRV